MAITRATTTSKRKRKLADMTADIIDLTSDTPPPTTPPFRFLDLAAELRNNIYEKLLEDASIDIRRRHAPSSKPKKRAKQQRRALPQPVQWQNLIQLPEESFALASTNKQIREELLSIALTSAPIHTRVFDADFTHIVACLNRLGDTELDRLASRDTTQKMHLWLEVGRYSWPDPKMMYRWLKRMDMPTKRGGTIDFVYHTEASTPVPWPADDESGVDAWRMTVRRSWGRGPRFREEREKIR